MIQFAFVSQFPHLQIDVAIKPILYIYNNQIYVVWNSYSYMVNDKKNLSSYDFDFCCLLCDWESGEMSS